MRRVSRTHRVALDWLFDRSNLDPQIQIKYVDTKKELADILTKGNFTRDEWNHLLRLFNIRIFSSASCPQTMLKRIQDETGEERIMAKSRPTLNLVSRTVASSSTAQSSSASNVPGILKATSQSLSLKASAGRPAASEANQNLDFQASVGRPAAEVSGIVDVDSCGETISRYLLRASHIF